MTPWEMAQDVELDDVSPTTGLRRPATVVCDHRPGVLAFLAAALSGAVVGGLVVLALLLLAAPRPAAQATARVDLFPGLSPARLTEAPLPRAGTTGVSSPARLRAELSDAVLDGLASHMGHGVPADYLALPWGSGVAVEICGPAACVRMRSTDAGPSLAMQRRGRVADLSVAVFERVCGCSSELGLVPVVVTRIASRALSRPTLPPTDG